MAYTILPDGSVRVETVDELKEALALMRENRMAPLSVHVPRPATVAGPERVESVVPDKPSPQELAELTRELGYTRLFREASDEQKRLIRFLVGVPGWATLEDIRNFLGLANDRKLRGVLIGIVRRATSQGVTPPILSQATRSSGGKREYRYRITDEFRRAVPPGVIFPKREG